MATNISELPEGCLSHILSLTSPVDVLRSSAVSKQFLSASESDVVWEKLLPSDYNEIISKSSTPLEFRSKKDLVLHLCTSHILIDAGTKSFALDKWNGKKCYMLGARALAITWGDTPMYWTWTSIPGSRFQEVAVLKDVCWLEIVGKIHTKLLTPFTTYGVYFVFKMTKRNNFKYIDEPAKVYVSEVDEDGLSIDCNHNPLTRSFYLTGLESENESENESGDVTDDLIDHGFIWTESESEENGEDIYRTELESEEDLEYEYRTTEVEREEEVEDVHRTILDSGEDVEYECGMTKLEPEEDVDRTELQPAEDVAYERRVTGLESNEDVDKIELKSEEDVEYEHNTTELESKEDVDRTELHSVNDVEHEHKTKREDLPVERGDGWREIEMGTYHVTVDAIEERVVLRMSLMMVEKGDWKNGLIVHGIELRPLN